MRSHRPNADATWKVVTNRGHGSLKHRPHPVWAHVSSFLVVNAVIQQRWLSLSMASQVGHQLATLNYSISCLFSIRFDISCFWGGDIFLPTRTLKGHLACDFCRAGSHVGQFGTGENWGVTMRKGEKFRAKQSLMLRENYRQGSRKERSGQSAVFLSLIPIERGGHDTWQTNSHSFFHSFRPYCSWAFFLDLRCTEVFIVERDTQMMSLLEFIKVRKTWFRGTAQWDWNSCVTAHYHL